MSIHFVTALPVYNEAKTVNSVLDEVVKHSPNILVVDDGSTDGTAELLSQRNDIVVVTHRPNKGYGAAAHWRGINEHGPCAIHRMSFHGVRPLEKTANSLFGDQ